jgi:hypothetical protein
MEELQDAIEDAQYMNAMHDGIPRPTKGWKWPTQGIKLSRNFLFIQHLEPLSSGRIRCYTIDSAICYQLFLSSSSLLKIFLFLTLLEELLAYLEKLRIINPLSFEGEGLCKGCLGFYMVSTHEEVSSIFTLNMTSSSLSSFTYSFLCISPAINLRDYSNPFPA